MENDIPLAKITPPGLPRVLQRKRLFQQLDKSKERQVVWVEGPPGAGKTTLVCSYLDNRDISYLWYQIDEEDANVATFFHYLGLAGNKAAPRQRKPLPHLTPEYLSGQTAFTRQFFKELFNRMQSPFALVLDNYQEIPGDAKIHEIIRDSLAQLPQEGMLFVISRNSPPAALARTQANQGMTVLGWKDLSLTADESRSIAKLWRLKQPLKEVLNNLHGQAEGWVAGLVLMLDSFNSGRVNPQAIRDTTKTSLFDYFASEILERTKPDTWEFLLKTAFLGSMTAKSATALTGNKDTAKILSDLNRQYYFTEKYVKTETVYQHHSLFREFLIERAKQQFSPDQLIEIQNKAAEILIENEQPEAAAGLLIETRNWESLIGIACDHAPSLLKQGRTQTLKDWLEPLPLSIVEKSPWVRYWQGASRLPYNLKESRELLEQSFDLFNKAQDMPGSFLAWASIVDTYLYEWGNFSDLDKWIRILDELNGKAVNFPSVEIEARVSASMFSALMYRQPQHPDFSFWEERVKKLILSELDLHHRVMIGNHLMLYYSWLGNLSKAALIIEALSPAIKDKHIDPLTLIIWHSMESMYQWLTLDNTACLKSMEKGLKIAKETGIHLWSFMLYAQGMYGALNSGDLVKATGLLDKMATSMHGSRRLDVAHYHYQAASLALSQNNLPTALEHAQSALTETEKAGSPFPITLASLGMAQVLFERGDEAQAQNYLKQAVNINNSLNSQYIEHHKLLIEAYFNCRNNRTDKALDLLKDALALGRLNGYFTMTWWRPTIMVKLCSCALKNNIETEYVQQLIRKQNLLPETDVTEDVESWPWDIRIYTLGRFSLLSGGEPLRFSGRAQSKPLELLKALIAFGGREVSEHKLVEALWPDAEGDAAHRAFDTTLHRLRKLIGSDKAIILQESRLTLDPRYCWVDIWAFERLLGKMDSMLRSGRCSTITETADKIMGLYQGPFLGDAADMSWAISLRDRLHSKFLRQLSAAGKYWESTKQWDAAIDFYRRALEADPLAEEFYQHLMACYDFRGRRAEALTTYQRCKNTLKSLLDIDPSPATEKLRQKILSGR